MLQYSAKNQQKIRDQLPTATDVKPLREWNKCGRHVRKGERAIWVIAPVAWKKDEALNKDIPAVFKECPVFDISQTEENDIIYDLETGESYGIARTA